MTPERWQQINEVFHEALVRPVGERTDFLAEACAGDAELLAEVSSLLEGPWQPGEFTAAPVYEAAAELFVETQRRSLAGANIGAYRIPHRSGAGGRGEVYRAEHTRLGRQMARKGL